MSTEILMRQAGLLHYIAEDPDARFPEKAAEIDFDTLEAHLDALRPNPRLSAICEIIGCGRDPRPILEEKFAEIDFEALAEALETLAGGATTQA